MAVRNIVLDSNPLIRKQSKTVTEFNKSLWELLDDMYETMTKQDGLGIAGVQVGVLKRVVVIEINGMKLELINPKIISAFGEQCEVEGCLSVRNISGYVKRPKTVTISCVDRYNNPYEITGNNLLAKAFCHELDHLDGILFTDKMEKTVVGKNIK